MSSTKKPSDPVSASRTPTNALRAVHALQWPVDDMFIDAEGKLSRNIADSMLALATASRLLCQRARTTTYPAGSIEDVLRWITTYDHSKEVHVILRGGRRQNYRSQTGWLTMYAQQQIWRVSDEIGDDHARAAAVTARATAAFDTTNRPTGLTEQEWFQWRWEHCADLWVPAGR